MLKQLLVICFIGSCHFGMTQNCVVDLGFNHNSNNLIGLFNTDVESHCEVFLYYWDFGDGATASGENLVHAYETKGTYTVCLTVNGEMAMKPAVLPLAKRMFLFWNSLK